MLKSIIMRYINEYIESQQHIKNMFILDEEVSTIVLNFEDTDIFDCGLYSIKITINNNIIEKKLLEAVNLECVIDFKFFKYLDIECSIKIEYDMLGNDFYYFDGNVLHYNITEDNFTNLLLFKEHDVKSLMLYLDGDAVIHGKLQYEIDFDFSNSAKKKLIDVIEILNYMSGCVMSYSFKVFIKLIFKRINLIKEFNEWINLFMSEHQVYFELFDNLQSTNQKSNFNFYFSFDIFYYYYISVFETKSIKFSQVRENVDTIVNLLLPKLKSFIYFSNNRVDIKIRTYESCFYIEVNDINSFSYKS